MNRFEKLMRASAATVIIFTVMIYDAEAREIKSKFPNCKGKHSVEWNDCYGEMTYGEGQQWKTYKGEFKNGVPHGKGVRSDGVFTFVGTFENGYENGRGIKTMKYEGHESKREGTWIDGRQEGTGSEINSDGSRYDGNFENGYKSGQGIEVTKNKEKYIGEFKFDNRHGNGTLIYSNGMRFVGKFKFGKKHGVGRFFAEDGTKIQVSQYRGDKLNGFSFNVDWNGKQIHEGLYQDGVLVRKESIDESLLEENFIDINIEKFLVENPNNLPLCPKKSNGYPDHEKKCWDRSTLGGALLLGEHHRSKRNGLGFQLLDFDGGYAIIGEYQDDKLHGSGMQINASGQIIKEGIYQLGELVEPKKVDVPIFLKKEYLEAVEGTKQLRKTKIDKNFNLKITHTEPADGGIFTINISANAEIASLLIDGKEHDEKKDRSYSIKRVARAGQVSSFEIIAIDIYGNKATETIKVSRKVVESSMDYAPLKPSEIKRQPERDAVAIIIGIADYKNLPRADYANDDARVFYDYAIRALGVKPEKIKLLVDADADDIGIYQAFKTWLPSRVRASTDVYVYYSGHGLPTADGQGIYLLPQRAHRDFIDKTAITQAEINAAIQAAKPKSVTVFLDACYSGQARTGETLLTSARPVALKMEKQLFPENFTVISASQADQISSSSPDLKHGIFSYYLMRGMEGDADTNKDGRITAGEMHTYLTEQVARQAGMMNRQQVPQLVGDANRVLVGR